MRRPNMIAIVISAWLLLSVHHGLSAVGQTASETSLESAGLDANSLEKFHQEIVESIQAGKVVGCAAALMKDHQLIYAKTWGQRNREESLPVEDDTIWRIYSMTKPITSVAVMQLVEAGKLKLDEPASSYLPDFKDLNVLVDGEEVDCLREMTVRDLLRHTSGLSYGFFGDTPVDQAYKKAGVLIFDKNLAETVSKLGKIPLLHQPGTRFHYSASTDVLGRVVEVASGVSFKDYLQQNIFDPLDMRDTFFTVPEDKRDRFAQMYAPDGSGGLKPARKMASYRFVNDTGFYSGGGGLCSTTGDYLRFCQMLLNEGEFDGQRLLESETVRDMTRNQLPDGASGRGFQFGLGFAISPQGHYAWGGAAGTRFWVDPQNEIIGVYMIQINPNRGRQFGNRFKQTVYESMLN